MKCCTLHFGRDNPHCRYYIDNEPLAERASERDLGVIFDAKICFDDLITGIVNKARRLAGYMFRSFRSRNSNVIIPIFKSLIRPILEYASPVWNPYLCKHIKLIESVQRYVTKRITGYSSLSYADRLKKLKLPSLQSRREYTDLLHLFKIVHGKCTVRCSTGLSFLRSNTRGHALRLQKPKFRLNIREGAFFVRNINIWNALPASVAECETFGSFKRRLRRHLCRV